jgi:hypothetical protein
VRDVRRSTSGTVAAVRSLSCRGRPERCTRWRCTCGAATSNKRRARPCWPRPWIPSRKRWTTRAKTMASPSYSMYSPRCVVSDPSWRLRRVKSGPLTPAPCVGQGKEDLTLLGNRSDTVMHYAKDTIQHGSSTEEAVAALKLAFHSFVMADALIMDRSQLSYAAGWLSRGWMWGFGFNRARMGGNDWNLFDDNGDLAKEKIMPPKWLRQAPGRHHRRLASRRSLLVDFY